MDANWNLRRNARVMRHPAAMIVTWFLCVITLGVSVPVSAQSTSHKVSSRAAGEGEPSGNPETDQTLSALETSRWRRVHLQYVPSFSPYVRLEYAWSQRGSWLVTSSIAHWSPPIPAVNSSALMERDEVRAWRSAVRNVLGVATPVGCDDGQQVARGEARLRIEREENAEVHCFLLQEDAQSGRLARSVDALMEFAPRIPTADRWTHPFWLVDASGTLRLELKGTAELAIDGELYGRVNGVLTLRLPVGRRVLTLAPVRSDAVQQIDVFLQKEQTTILRISVEDEAMTTVPSWSQPQR